MMRFDYFLSILKTNRLKTNSKDIKKGDIFVAIRQGNSYLQEAIQNGASVVVYDSEKIFCDFKNSYKVENSIEFLQKLAKKYRETLNTKIIGITGSNGKTTTKDIIYEILSLNKIGKKTEGNLNNHIGVPITILGLEEKDEFAVIEMGMSNLGEIDLLADIVKPEYSIITNIGDSHLEFLKNRKNIFKAKSEIINHTRNRLFINGDDEYLKKLSGIKIGFGKSNDLSARNIIFNEEYSTYLLKCDLGEFNVKLNLVGEHNILNSMFGIAIGLEFGYTINEILDRIANIKISKMRFEKIKRGDTIFINDAYNASPISTKYSLKTFSKLYEDRLKIVILADMLELGEKSRKLHEDLSDNIMDTKADIFIFYGNEMKYLYKKVLKDKRAYYFENKKDIIKLINELSGKKAILLKGSRGMKLEEIIC
ncbi:UDP-N-acetylmuramoyl-tripeptide--D-alanyl-D-alanine ligase [Haliovirga abyssi]|uniref:UDP-N-acetylmuramoyl-tripeptide--D-alanyl-D-alanine ligase n=1 Tax=Haliovirga abyssi TaxID=2996794 RepID=A0AAU9D4W8_9FUSO|nr:UDP-N-acetylmuramoyl-tripeptide--D-alanyl-D-alanine ligase [Haliovirga abyssi]BDU49593.1 hypothetical protein HLVA_01620 [Haliovirga abyssi]